MPAPKPTDPEEKLVEAGLLFDTYGALLTERQRTFIRLHFDEDLSFSDVARQFNITRQAVHDSVKHAMTTLRSLEKALGLVARSNALSLEITGRLEELRDRVRRRRAAIKPGWVAGELDKLIALARDEEE